MNWKEILNMSEQDRYMLILRGGKADRSLSPNDFGAVVRKYLTWIDELRRSGRYEGGEPLEEKGKTVSGSRGSIVIDGPFAEAKELVGGYFILKAANLDEAAEIAKGCPIFENGGTVEVRKIAPVPTAADIPQQ
jgi:hypothetical protein